MTIGDDVATWALGRPAWQRQVLAELADGHEFTDEDVGHLADGIAASDAATDSTALSIKPGTEAQVQLVEIAEVRAVNALIEGEKLSFGQDGLTVVYGDNGSGKSGYARLIKNMIKTRHEEPVLANVFEDSGRSPGAELTYTTAGSRRVQKLGAPVPPVMRKMTFYDVNCGELYITSSSTVNYRPSALALLEGLVAVCDRATKILNARSGDLNREALQLNVPEGTSAALFISSLTAKTTSEEIDAATELPPSVKSDLVEALAEEARLLGTDPTKEKSRLLRLALQLSDLTSDLDELLSEFTSDRISKRVEVKQKAIDLRRAADLAAKRTFDETPVSGVGSATWRALWDAARQFSLTEGYHDHEFPVIDDDAKCVLCQQPLSESAKSRMTQFEQFVGDTTAQQADAAEAAYARALDELHALVIQSVEHTNATAALASVESDLGQAADDVLTKLEVGRGGLLAHLTSDASLPSPVPGSWLSSKLRVVAERLQTQAGALDVEGFTKSVGEASQRKAELHASVTLSEADGALRKEVTRLQELDRLRAAIAAARSYAITSKITELTRRYVTEEISGRFQKESRLLGLDNVRLDDLGGHKGQLKQQPKLVGTTSDTATTTSVLSEGEQTALGLAGFFTEATIDPSNSALIFDDPITSLDHVRRGRVAKRIAQLAQERQVVVFTHDLSFVVDLSKYAGDEGIGFHGRSIERRGPRPGACLTELPWKAKDFGQRKDQLGRELATLRKERAGLTTSEWEKKVALWAGELSELWERCVSTEIIDQLFDPTTSETRVRKLRLLAKFTVEDEQDYQNGYGLTSVWAKRHHKALIKNYVPPEPDEMEAELVRISDWRKQLKKYVNAS